MNKKAAMRFIPAILFMAFVSYGCTQTSPSSTAMVQKPAAVDQKKVSTNTYTGSVVGKSNKAKTIAITVGKGDDAKTMMVRFDDNTKGLEFAKKGEAAIITWEDRGDEKFATIVKPKLAKLPDGVSEIKVDELHQLISQKIPMTLVDSRPQSRYNQAHLPGAISIPVPKLKEKKQTILPADKSQLLIFYCGGYT